MRCNPIDVLREANENAIVSHCLEYWKKGRLPWDNTMMLMVCLLSEQNQSLMKNEVNLVMLKPPRPVEVEEKKFFYNGPCPACGHKPGCIGGHAS